MSKSPQSHQAVEKSGFWLSNLASKSESVLLALLILFLPTQLGKHFWPAFSIVSGIRVDYLSPTLYFNDILVMCLLLLTLFRWNRKAIMSFLKQNIVGVLFLLFFLETALFALRPPLGFYYWLKLVEFSFVGMYIARSIRTIGHMIVVSLLLSIGVFFESLLAILQYVQQGSLNGWLYYLGERTFTGETPGIANASLDGTLILRPYGTFSHPNVLAAYLVLSSILIVFYVVRKQRGLLRYYGIGSVLLASVALILTLSRSAIVLWFALICSLLIAFVFKKRSYRKGFFIAIVVGILVSVVMLPFLQHLFTRFTETSLHEDAVVQRSILLADAGTIALSHPFTGAGLGNFIPALAPLAPPLSLTLYLQPVHNIFFLSLAETGFLGLFIFLWFLTRTFLRIREKIKNTRYQKEYGMALLLLTCVFFLGLFDHFFLTLEQGQLFFAIILGFCWMTIVSTKS